MLNTDSTLAAKGPVISLADAPLTACQLSDDEISDILQADELVEHQVPTNPSMGEPVPLVNAAPEFWHKVAELVADSTLAEPQLSSHVKDTVSMLALQLAASLQDRTGTAAAAGHPTGRQGEVYLVSAATRLTKSAYAAALALSPGSRADSALGLNAGTGERQTFPQPPPAR